MYRLAQAACEQVSEHTALWMPLARDEPGHIDLGTLGAVINTLEELIGKPVRCRPQHVDLGTAAMEPCRPSPFAPSGGRELGHGLRLHEIFLIN